MEKTVLILLCLWSVSISNAQVNDLIGKWTRFEQTQLEFGSSPVIMNEDYFKAEGTFADYLFMEDGKFVKTDRLLGDDKVYTLNGTWKITENSLLMTFQQTDKQEHIINYTYQLRKDTLTMTLYSPDGKDKLVVSYRKTKL